MSSHTDRAIFLDRDGTIIEDVPFLTQIEQIRVLPGVPEALRLLKEAGFVLVVVTNQSAIARGRMTETGLACIHDELSCRLAQWGVAIDAFYYCPHLPGAALERYDRECECRRPGAGLLERAASDRYLDLRRSYMIGDSMRDMEAGRRAGCPTILIAHAPSGSDNRGRVDTALADAVAPDLMSAARLVLQDDRAKGTWR